MSIVSWAPADRLSRTKIVEKTSVFSDFQYLSMLCSKWLLDEVMVIVYNFTFFQVKTVFKMPFKTCVDVL